MFRARRGRESCVAAALALAAVFAVTGGKAGAANPMPFAGASSGGHVRISAGPEPGLPIPIGEFHAWSLHLTDGEGRPLDGARITVGGGMEGHGHGLPTAPEVTKALGGGGYRVEGVKFTMAGEWSLVFRVHVGSITETVRLDFEVGVAATRDAAVDGWSDEEIEVLRSLSLYDVRQPPPSPSNRVADDPRAARLGRRLFFEPRLSGNGEVACDTCHQPSRYFTDGRRRSQGTGTTLRNAPTVVGSAYNSWFYWDGRRDSLWSQALIPLEAPEEMGSSREAVIDVVLEDPTYLRMYRDVFGETPRREGKGLDRAFANVGKAIAAYERTLDPPATRFDRYVVALLDKGEAAAARLLDPEEIAGARLFIDEPRTRCLRCHNGPMLTNGSFHNIGTGNLEGERLDFGRAYGLKAARLDPFNCLGEFSDAAADQCRELRFLNEAPHVPLEGAFKVPSLRGVPMTAPYMHDGSMEHLDAVLEHYRTPPRDGGTHELVALELSDEELARLVAFLQSLSPRRPTGPKAPAP